MYLRYVCITYIRSGMAGRYTSWSSTGTRPSVNILSDVTRTSAVRWVTTREIPLGCIKATWYTAAIYFNYYYYFSIHLTDFILITFYWVYMLKSISSTKIRNNTEEEPFGIPVAITESDNDLRINMIVESEIGFLL